MTSLILYTPAGVLATAAPLRLAASQAPIEDEAIPVAEVTVDDEIPVGVAIEIDSSAPVFPDAP